MVVMRRSAPGPEKNRGPEWPFEARMFLLKGPYEKCRPEEKPTFRAKIFKGRQMNAHSNLDGMIAEYMQLATTNVSDALDRLRLDGAPQGIFPLWPGCRKIVGPAATMKLVPVGESSASPVSGSLEAVMAGRPGDVLVIDHGGNMEVNSYGGIVGFTTHHRKLSGCIIDGVARDVDEYKELDLPVYARGIVQQSIRNRCAFGGFGIEVQLGGVRVRPGDLVMSDGNGVVVIPKENAEEALTITKECKTTEERIVEAIRGGENPVDAHEKVRYDSMTSPPRPG
ncbi:MAG TPA: dimethylmenaquinone methyltransferase [Nitrospinae bacterium]|nr:dimethylmenaquinone methyltransferase [Nitrospinota bacterium]